MSDLKIKNIIFDVGNVLVKWSPADIIKNTFPYFSEEDKQEFVSKIFKSNIWKDLNLGKFSEKTAKNKFTEAIELSESQIETLFENIKKSQSPISGMHNLLSELHKRNIVIYALTDNVKEIIVYLKNRYDFWRYFSDVIVSADIGLLKPDPKIFKFLLEKNNLYSHETLFIDDYLPNVKAALSLGIRAFQFVDYEKCCSHLKKEGVFI